MINQPEEIFSPNSKVCKRTTCSSQANERAKQKTWKARVIEKNRELHFKEPDDSKPSLKRLIKTSAKETQRILSAYKTQLE